MTFTISTTETFREKFCRHFDVPARAYEAEALRLTLYPHAQWLQSAAPHGLLAPDRDFIAAVGRLTQWRGFAGEARDFQLDARNRRFLRRSLRLRVSVARMRALFSEVWGTTVPAAGDPSRSADPDHSPSSLLTG